jgi:splicing factor 1
MGGSPSMQPPASTGQTGPFSSLGGDPANSMQMGGNMLSSTPPTGAGTMQSLAGTMGHPSTPFGQSSGAQDPAQPSPGISPPAASAVGQIDPMQSSPGMVAPPTQPGPGQGMPGSTGGTTWGPSGGMGLFGGGNQQSQMMQEIMQMLKGGGGNAWGT